MKNWKTTAAMFAAAVLNLVANGVTWKQALLSAAIAVAGSVQKDRDVTGAGDNAHRVPS